MIKVIDAVSNKQLRTAKSEKQAKTIIYALERNDRHTGDFEPDRYIIVITGHKRDRLNKQARRAFELQEV